MQGGNAWITAKKWLQLVAYKPCYVSQVTIILTEDITYRTSTVATVLVYIIEE